MRRKANSDSRTGLPSDASLPCPQNSLASFCVVDFNGLQQVLDGPPGDATRRPSTFLLIPVGYNRQGFAFGRATAQADGRGAATTKSAPIDLLKVLSLPRSWTAALRTQAGSPVRMTRIRETALHAISITDRLHRIVRAFPAPAGIVNVIFSGRSGMARPAESRRAGRHCRRAKK